MCLGDNRTRMIWPLYLIMLKIYIDFFEFFVSSINYTFKLFVSFWNLILF